MNIKKSSRLTNSNHTNEFFPSTHRNGQAQLEAALNALKEAEPDFSMVLRSISLLSDMLSTPEMVTTIHQEEAHNAIIALNTLSLVNDGIIRWFLVKELVIFSLEEIIKALYQVESQKQQGEEILPILIAARNEALALPDTLKRMLKAKTFFEKRHPDIRVMIFIADNASTDGTFEVVQKFIEAKGLESEIRILREPTPGKNIALKTLINHLIEKGYGGNRVVLVDAEIVCSEDLLTKLWDCMESDDELTLVGANCKPEERQELSPRFWGIIEMLPLLRYDGKRLKNNGRFPLGACRMGKRKEAFRFLRTISDMGSDDLFDSVLAGGEHIYVVCDAVVRYHLSETWYEFFKIRGKHISRNAGSIRSDIEREYSRIITEAPDLDPRDKPFWKRWWTIRKGRILARKSVLKKIESIVELKISKICARFFKSSQPFKLNFSSLMEFFRGIPILNLPFKYVVAIVLMPFVYTSMHVYALFQLRLGIGTTTWEPIKREKK